MKTTYGLQIFFLILIFTNSGNIQATTASPSLNAKCSFAITHPVNASSTIYFDEGCTTVYIGPPIKGKAEIGSIARTTNLQFCPSVKRAQVAVQSIVGSIEQSGIRISQMIKDFDPLDKELVQLRIKLAVSRVDMEEKAEMLAASEAVREEKLAALSPAKFKLS